MNKRLKKREHGLTLIEILVAVGIVAVLVAIAVPSYLHYIKRSEFIEVVQAGDNLKAAVTQCAKKLGRLRGCSGGTHGVPKNIISGNGHGLVDSISVTDGVITVIPQTTKGFVTDDTYILIPKYKDQEVIWETSGGSCAAGYAPGC